LQSAPGEEVVEVEHAAGVEHRFDGFDVHAGHGDVAAQAVDRDDHGREEQLLPEIRQPPSVEQGLQHQAVTSMVRNSSVHFSFR
jgi:hypothetical protein